MSALDNLTIAFNDVRMTVSAAVERIQYLAHDLAYARAEAAEAAAVEQIAAELHATADQLRAALAASGETPPHA